ncbi:NADH-quinone oxidoreductase subunit J [Candidatus Liberibacter africanus]|uniref:NADH-quinone oxidoreductase subunit J n=1 Tax=Candidatus Liberibacter africanus PTSAPSY TaxID=1277257 RepID=A0A0G3I1P2_LIBAF|nr:NADH-quinone oxidoreductase subunit J [Candidatus Liberibacter africanus]AKK19779.1 NADH dehydrogenase subunit J [Candidatus Liberibacter africanus PTSAPSY]QTP63651.1 NADH-quinone oxidoreductase subunit J [Candidatus Liberibacter africanus]
MVMHSLFFYLFSFMTIISAFLVVIARNPIYSVFSLIFAFVNSAGLFLLLGAEFIAMITLIVYVGAVIVFFLFIIMMLDIDVVKAETKQKRRFLGSFFIGILAAELIICASNFLVFRSESDFSRLAFKGNNVENIGEFLYTKYAYPLEISGFILLLSMIGVIVLMLHSRRGVKRQDISKQLESSPENSIVMVKVKSGEGI